MINNLNGTVGWGLSRNEWERISAELSPPLLVVLTSSNHDRQYLLAGP